jgi:putative oxidoreductase
MKVAVVIARTLVGFVFVFFGSNAFLHFLNAPLPEGVAGQFIGALVASHYVVAVGACQVIGGALLLAGRYIPLGLTILGPVVVNILLYHLLMSMVGFPVALVVALLWVFLMWRYRANFAGLFVAKAA